MVKYLVHFLLCLTLLQLLFAVGTCQVENCTVKEPVGGESTCSANDVVDAGTECYITCYVGYYPTVLTSLNCTSQDSWSENWDGICSIQNCTVPDVTGGTTNCISGGIVDAGTGCNIHCDVGYYLQSKKSPNCTSQDNWSDSWTVCSNVTCAGSPKLDHGGVQVPCTNDNYGDECALKCNEGYFISGVGLATCSDLSAVEDDSNMYGDWIIADTVCTVENCTVKEPVGGESNCSANDVVDAGTECDITCYVGYYLTVLTSPNCTSQDSWSENWDGICSIQNCTAPDVTGGTTDCTSGGIVDSGTVCNIHCDVGYYLKSQKSPNCTSQDSWSDSWNVCSNIVCAGSPELDNGGVQVPCANGIYDDDCALECNEGYFISGERLAKCTDNSTLEDDSNMYGDWNTAGTLCTVYMLVMTNNTDRLAVKYGNVTLSVDVESNTADVNISVFLISSPRLGNYEIPLNMISPNNGLLTFEITIYNLSESDDGTYEFESRSSSQDTLVYPNITSTAFQTVTIEVVPENLRLFPSGPRYTYVRGNKFDTIQCNAYGIPTPTITWEARTGNCTGISDCTGKTYTADSVLYLDMSYFSDNGTFVCNAVNNASERYNKSPHTDIVIDIVGNPVNTGGNEALSPQDNITLFCLMDANPIPDKVAWSLDNSEYDQSTNVFVDQSEVSSADDKFYYKYQNSLTLTSQLCMGEQSITCAPQNDYGASKNPTTHTLNTGNYDLYAENYFTFPEAEENFTDVQQKCQNSQGSLVYIKDSDTQAYLNSATNYSFYIGAVRSESGAWTWGAEGPNVDSTYTNWTVIPDEVGKDCAISGPEGWEAVNCNERHKYVCQLEASGIPKNLRINVEQCDGTYLNVAWNPADSNFATTEDRLIITNMNTSVVWQNISGSQREFTSQNAEPNIEYKVEVFAAVDVCAKFFPSTYSFGTTGFDIPETVSDAVMVATEGEELPICTLTWSYNPIYQWQIKEYEVTVAIALNEETGESPGDPAQCIPGKETSCSFTMAPNSKYTATVRAASCAGTGEEQIVDEICVSPYQAPAEPLFTSNETQPHGSFDDEDGITVVIPPQNQRNGPISCIFVVVTVDDSDSGSENREADKTMGNFESVKNGLNGQYFAYVTQKVTEKTTVVLGVGGQTTSCDPTATSSSRKKRSTKSISYQASNADLDSSKYYRYYFLSTTPTTSDGNMTFLIQSSPISFIYISNPYLGWIAGIVVPIFCLLVAAGGFYYYRRRKGKQADHGDDGFNMAHRPQPSELSSPAIYEEVEGSSLSPKPISQEHLEKTFHIGHKDDDRIFREEYKGIKDQAKKIDSRFAEAKEKRALNRFVNVLPASDARVELSIQRNLPDSDYINASYIDGYKQPKKFIATQGPKPNTVDDFWRMVWEKSTEGIVMLTNVDEGGRRKCEKYWPDEGTTSNHGDLSVTGLHFNQFGPIERRTFKVKHFGQEKKVVQYHYRAWPDHGVPLTTSDLFNLRRLVREEFGKNELPIVVHCSAGVGRTGTFIGLDYLMRELEDKKSVDIRMQVWRMRMNRTEMVQTADQYVLLHKMLLEYYLLGATDMSLSNAEEKVEDLSEQLLKNELNLLKRIPPMDNETELASSNEHKNKNRNQDAIPYDHNVTSLRMRPDEREAPYLNASMIQGYDMEDKFIVMQDPIPGGEELVWRMVLDYNVKCIVMIRKKGETQDLSAKYWPEKHSEQFGTITASVLETFVEKNVIQRNIFVKEAVLTSTRSSSVHQIEFTGWPSDPREGVGSIIDLISRVQRHKQTAGQLRGPILIHCGDGSELTGTFCAITNLLERLKLENRVDVLRTVKDLRDLRPNMVSDMNEYRLCYLSVPEYLKTFDDDTYSNFR